MHHNPELYPEPERFRPERFIGETQQARTWLPWGGGRKHCLGRHFALLEVQRILREVLATKRVLPAGDRVEAPRWRSARVPGLCDACAAESEEARRCWRDRCRTISS